MHPTKTLAIILARSGSKGLKDKNIRPLNNKPLIQHTIESARNSNIFKEILVSTDSLIYKDIAERAGAWVPFLREPELSGDLARSNDVLVDILSKLKDQNKTYDHFMLLQPTSPLRNEKHIQEAYQLFMDKSANAVVSITEAEHSPLWCNTVKPDLCIDHFLSNAKSLRQQLETFYRINGAIYLLNVDYFLEHMDFYHSKSYGYVMDKYSSVDIDDLLDFKFAEFLMTNKTEMSV